MDLYRQHIEMLPKFRSITPTVQNSRPRSSSRNRRKPRSSLHPSGRTACPAPQPEPEPNQPIPEDVPAPQPAAPEESYPAYEEPEYYEAEPEKIAQPEEPEPAPAPAPGQPLDEEKIDTVEFAFAPKTKPILPDDDMPSGLPGLRRGYAGKARQEIRLPQPRRSPAARQKCPQNQEPC